ncbi:hypothetical protein KGF54_003646 [Candida jiufengensis]|uniref:uncharacterized protein n=1 Tax=Candida jiufengensis TaxID=497108 RepID=UPI00222433F6|nr:uncharacterized protein KGF54_003646 [Candida jiufengensis]KAI5952779.1 hypothetical protein KGF54_003646 [Candida jiufengensis]
MIGIRRSIKPLPTISKSLLTKPCIHPILIRSYATTPTDNETPEPKKKKKQLNIAQVPISYIGVMSDLYVSPKLTKYSPLKWPKLVLRRIMVFAFNTYNVIKFKREIGQPLNFNKWKDQSIENYIKTNKIFAQSCNKASSLSNNKSKELSKFVNLKLDQCCGKHLIEVLIKRSENFNYPNGKINWELKSIDSNPKITMFNVIPDQDGIGCYVQYIMNLRTTQVVTITNKSTNEIIQENETKVDDYLVYTMNPFNDKILLVGKLFESNSERGLKPDLDVFNPSEMQKFVLKAADIYREDPNNLKINKTD